MAKLIDPPRLTESRVDVPENIRQLLRSAQRDTPSLSEIASLKQKLTPLLNTPPSPGGLVGPLNGSIAGIGKIVAVSTLVVASGFTYWALKNQTTDLETPSSSVDSRTIDSKPIDIQERLVVERPAPTMSTVPQLSKTASKLQPKPLHSKSQTERKVAPDIRAKPVRNDDPDKPAEPTIELQESVDSPIHTKKYQNEMDEAELLDLAKKSLPNDPAQTLRLTFEHYRKFRTGVLGEEREVLIIEALVRLERKEEAQARTRNFLAVYPHSVYRRRLSRQVFTDK